MTQPLVSFLLPHLRNADNDAALRICLDCIVANTSLNYELLLESVAERRDIYAVVNDMAKRANSDWLVFMNTDVFVSGGWIKPLWEARDHNTIVSPVMVECGAIPVSDRNLEMDFGRTPQAFRRTEFEEWVRQGAGWRDEWIPGERAWYFPSLINRNMFNWMGGFDTSQGAFPDPLDKWFWDKWQRDGKRIERVRSFVYHLQAFSDGARPDATR